MDKLIIKEYLLPGAGVKTVARKLNIRRQAVETVLQKHKIHIKTNGEIKSQLIGDKSPRYGKQPPIGAGRCRWYYYHGKKYQGTWEFMFGLWLEQQNIKFNVHEDVKQFMCVYDDSCKFTYCPDFYLLDYNRFIEVKGYFSPESRQRFELFKKQYPNIDVAILDKNKLIEIGAFGIQKQLNIELELYQLDYENEKSVKKFIESIDKIEFVKTFIVGGYNLSKLAQKYDTPYRVVNHIYNLWVPEHNSNEFYQFILENCKDDIIKDCKAGLKCQQIIRKYKFRSNPNVLLDAINKWGAKINRLQEPGKKVIQDDIKKSILSDYEQGLSKHAIVKKYHLKKKHINRILINAKVQQRPIAYYTSTRFERNRQQVIDGLQQNIINDYVNGLGIRTIGKNYNVPRNIIKKLLLDNNIEIRPSSTYSSDNAKKKVMV